MSLDYKAWAVLLVAGLAGCSQGPAPNGGTGAKEAAQRYYEALVRLDWQQAYAALHPDSRKDCTSEQFAELAEIYVHNLGFNSEAVRVHVSACEEQGAEAIAHVILTGRAASETKRYKDGMVLRQSGDKWYVILPQNFGQKT